MGGAIHTLAQIAEHPAHLVRIGSRSQNTILRTLELRGRNHLHGFGNFLRILKGGDFSPQRL